jgi:hypothetical protein
VRAEPDGRRHRWARRSALVVACIAVTAAAATGVRNEDHDVRTAQPPAAPSTTTTAPAATAATTAPPPSPFEGWVDPASVGQPYYSATVSGLLTFRGNPTRTYHGRGPIPREPRTLWKCRRE